MAEYQSNTIVKSVSRARHPPTDLFKVKVISLGSLSVGKTCLIKRFCEDRVDEFRYEISSKQFVSKYASTIGIDYGVKQVSIQGRDIKVNFWDLSGHEEFLEIRNEFYKDTQGVIKFQFHNLKRGSFDF